MRGSAGNFPHRKGPNERCRKVSDRDGVTIDRARREEDRLRNGWGAWQKISAGLCDNLTGTPNITVGTITTTGNVGIGTAPSSYKLDVVSGDSRINGNLIGAFNCVKRSSVYIKPTLNSYGNYYYWSLNYGNYLGNNSTTEYAFKIYVWNIQGDISTGYYYIGSIFVNIVNGNYTIKK